MMGRCAALVVSAGLVAGATALAAPGRADSTTDAFLNAVNNAGVAGANPDKAVEVGQSVCPMLAQPGQTTADVAGKVADSAGMSLGPATMFTGIAISIFCPAMVSKVGGAVPSIPLLGG